MAVPTSESSDLESDDESVILAIDPFKMLKSLSVLSTVKSSMEAILLMLSSISTRHANSSKQINYTTRKRPSNESKTGDSESKRARRAAERARKKEAEENIPKEKEKARVVNKEGKWKCYICCNYFHNQHNLLRHINNTTLHPKKYCEVNEHGVTRFRCGLCGRTLSNTGNANRHLRLSHSIVETPESKRRPRRIKFNADDTKQQPEEIDARSPDMFVCTVCDVAKPEVDLAIEHAQLHQLPVYKPIPQTCEICQFTFELQDFAGHTLIHETTNDFVIKYTPLQLLSNDWINMFQQIDNTIVNKIKSSSIYKHTRKVKMNTVHNDDYGTPLYRCDICERYVRPDEVEDHCNKEKDCAENQSGYHVCDKCELFFFTPEALAEHEKEDHESVIFRTITFNCEQDLPINRALRKLQDNSQQLGEISQKGGVSKSTGNKKGIVILDDRPVNVTQFCQDCCRFIPFSEIKAHEATHNNRNADIEHEENQMINEEVPDEQNYSSSIIEGVHGDKQVPIKDGDQIMNDANTFSCHDLQSNIILKEAQRIANITEQLENGSSEMNTSANQCKMIGLDADNIFKGMETDFFKEMETDLRQELQDNFDKYTVDNTGIQSKEMNEIIEISDEDDDEMSNDKLQSPCTSPDLNKVKVEEDEIADDRSKIETIFDKSTIDNKQSNETHDIFEVSDESEDENATESNKDSNEECDEEKGKTELERIIEEERRIREIMSRRD